MNEVILYSISIFIFLNILLTNGQNNETIDSIATAKPNAKGKYKDEFIV